MKSTILGLNNMNTKKYNFGMISQGIDFDISLNDGEEITIDFPGKPWILYRFFVKKTKFGNIDFEISIDENKLPRCIICGGKFIPLQSIGYICENEDEHLHKTENGDKIRLSYTYDCIDKQTRKVDKLYPEIIF